MNGTSPSPWSLLQLEHDRAKAVEAFRDARLREPLERYQTYFDKARTAVEELLELTQDLLSLESLIPDAGQTMSRQEAAELNQRLRALRYVTGPPLSADDLCVLAEAEHFTARYFAAHPESLERVIAIVRDNHDRERFPWIFPDAATPSEKQKEIACQATAALMASSSTARARRNDVSALHDEFAKHLLALGYHKVTRRSIASREALPAPGQFSRNSNVKPTGSGLRNTQATFVIRRHDGHAIVLASRVSGSYLNARKRLTNETEPRCRVWRETLGAETTSGAILSGVFTLEQLEDAQESKLHLWWFHTPGPLLAYIGLASGGPLPAGS
jgi:XamI-like restriction endonuclease